MSAAGRFPESWTYRLTCRRGVRGHHTYDGVPSADGVLHFTYAV